MPACTALPMGRGNRVFINLIRVECRAFLSFSLFNCFDLQASTSQCYGAFYIISVTEAKKVKMHYSLALAHRCFYISHIQGSIFSKINFSQTLPSPKISKF